MAKCEHGSYIPAGETVALYCMLCNPAGVPDGPAPILPRSSSDPLNVDRTEKRDVCTNCGNMRTYSFPNCRVCGAPFPITDDKGRQQGTANPHQDGACPDCGSAVHYDIGKGKYECADCGKVYNAPKRKRK